MEEIEERRKSFMIKADKNNPLARDIFKTNKRKFAESYPTNSLLSSGLFEALGNESSIPSSEPEEKFRKSYLTSIGIVLRSKQMKPIVKYTGCIDTENAGYKEGQIYL